MALQIPVQWPALPRKRWTKGMTSQYFWANTHEEQYLLSHICFLGISLFSTLKMISIGFGVIVLWYMCLFACLFAHLYACIFLILRRGEGVSKQFPVSIHWCSDDIKARGLGGGNGTLGLGAAGMAWLSARAHWEFVVTPQPPMVWSRDPASHCPTSLCSAEQCFHLSGLLLRHPAALGTLGILITPARFPVLRAVPGRLLHVAQGRGVGADVGMAPGSSGSCECSEGLSLQVPICSEEPFSETLREKYEKHFMFQGSREIWIFTPRERGKEILQNDTVSHANEAKSLEECMTLNAVHIKIKKLLPWVNNQDPPSSTTS